MDLRMTLPDHTQTGPEMTLRSPISQPQISNGQNKALFHVLSTIAEEIGDPSKDWIAPPSRSQEYTSGR